MKRKLYITTALLACVMLCFAAIASLDGKWNATFTAPDGSQYPLTYTFKVDGDKLTGTLDAVGETVTIDSGMVKGDDVSFNVTAQGVTYKHVGKYYAAGDSIAADVTFEGGKSHMTIKRAK
jgi:hypothetical protein